MPSGGSSGAGVQAGGTSGMAGSGTAGGGVGGGGTAGTGVAGGGSSGSGGSGPSGPLPEVYEEENTGADCPVTTSFPAFSALELIPEFPDPFLKDNGERITSRADWRCRCAEISAHIQKWELGTKPPPSAGDVSATFSGRLTVKVSVGGQSISLAGIAVTASSYARSLEDNLYAWQALVKERG